MEPLSQFRHIRILYLNGDEVTDTRMKCVAGLSELQYLNLAGAKITDAGLAHLEGLRSLNSLVLNDSQVNRPWANATERSERTQGTAPPAHSGLGSRHPGDPSAITPMLCHIRVVPPRRNRPRV